MPTSRAPHTVTIFGRDYTVAAWTDTRQRLDATALKLDEAMRAHQAREPKLSTETLAVLAALDLIAAALSSSAHEREIANGLTTLQRKLDRLEAALTVSTAISSEQSSANL